MLEEDELVDNCIKILTMVRVVVHVIVIGRMIDIDIGNVDITNLTNYSLIVGWNRSIVEVNHFVPKVVLIRLVVVFILEKSFWIIGLNCSFLGEKNLSSIFFRVILI